MEKFKIKQIPAVLYGEKTDRLFLFVHGKDGNKEEAEDFAKQVCQKGYQVLGIDLPGHGERKNEIDHFNPWDVIPELDTVWRFAEKCWGTIGVRANSIGAWFSMLAFSDRNVEKSLFVSPILDMERLIQNMMKWAGVSEDELEEKQEIETSFGETLSWKYYRYAKEYSFLTGKKEWEKPTAILYAGQDNLTERITVDAFCEKYKCSLTVMENGEHWFHTPEQMDVLHQWERDEI
ncbi:MAG: alpha/beta hydrolase [Lachnospiraceae bacterium]|nr:alpha/beta hydrolase [Lachnospiraceae bacterium]